MIDAKHLGNLINKVKYADQTHKRLYDALIILNKEVEFAASETFAARQAVLEYMNSLYREPTT